MELEPVLVLEQELEQEPGQALGQAMGQVLGLGQELEVGLAQVLEQ
jgi:hypothetical protein